MAEQNDISCFKAEMCDRILCEAWKNSEEMLENGYGTEVMH
jgi:hypothetical protein